MEKRFDSTGSASWMRDFLSVGQSAEGAQHSDSRGPPRATEDCASVRAFASVVHPVGAFFDASPRSRLRFSSRSRRFPLPFRLVLHEQRARATKQRSTRRATLRAAHRPSPRLFADHRRLRARETRACDVLVPSETPNPRRRRANPRPLPRTRRTKSNISVGLPRPARPRLLFPRVFRPAPPPASRPLDPDPPLASLPSPQVSPMSKKQTASGDPEFNDLGPLPGFAPPGDADVTPTDAGLSGRMPSIPADGGFLEENDLMHLDNVLDFEVTDPALAASAPPPRDGSPPTAAASATAAAAAATPTTGPALGLARATRKTSAQTSTPTIPSTNAGYRTAWRARDFAPRRRSGSWSSTV